ncbi:MAG: hypothetical protein IIC73_00780 [Armatimonadetes bacterium]|nr:hypothetical protein [Armatimonadota bacterium]
MLAQMFLAQYQPYDHYPGTAIAVQYRRWDAAYIERDVRVASDVLSREFRLVTGSGNETTKVSYLVSFRESRAPDEYATKMLRVKSRRHRAEVWTKETSDGEVHYYLDTWIKERGEWRLLGSKTLREEGH